MAGGGRRERRVHRVTRPRCGAPTTVVSGSGGVSGTTFTDTSASNGSIYSYAVRANSGGSQSANSNLVNAAPIPGSGSGNAIVAENSYPGTTAWKMQGAAQPPTGLEGFATQTSINAGDSVDLKVNTADGVPYHIEIYRTGYYGGSQARLVSVLTGLVGVGQNNPQKDPDLGLIDASNWSVTSTVTTTPDWPTGVYLLRLAREDNGSDNHIILVVRNDGASSDVVYALPVATYQAYNKWGGRSLYTFQSSGDPTVAGTPRAVKVSFDRPYNQSLNGLNNWYTACDIQNLSWLERQGYDMTYQTSVDVHTGSTLTNHSVYVSPAHDEYWSTEMRSAVTNARDSGVGLFFLGANGVYWRIRFEQNPFSGAANRIEVCYKTRESGPSDPGGTPTTTWRDPAGPNQPENGFIGQMYIGDNGSIFFPMVVSAAQGMNRIWRYTTLASLAPNTTSKIGKNLVGWEWDGRYPLKRRAQRALTVTRSAGHRGAHPGRRQHIHERPGDRHLDGVPHSRWDVGVRNRNQPVEPWPGPEHERRRGAELVRPAGHREHASGHACPSRDAVVGAGARCAGSRPAGLHGAGQRCDRGRGGDAGTTSLLERAMPRCRRCRASGRSARWPRGLAATVSTVGCESPG